MVGLVPRLFPGNTVLGHYLAKEANEVSTGSGSDRVNVGASAPGVTRSLPLAVLTQSSSFQFR